MKQPALLTHRAWPGFHAWLISVLSAVAVFECIALFAWKNEQGRMIDVTTAFVAIPAGAIMLLVAASFLWSWLGKTPFEGLLGWSLRLLPLTWAIPLFDLIRTYGNGVILGAPRLNGLQMLLAIATGGILPIDSGISIGMRLGMFASVIGVGIVTWHLSNTIWKAVLGSLLFSSLLVKTVSSLSILSIWRGAFTHTAWVAIPQEIVRRATVVVSQGYWWQNVYERFPTAIDGQIQIALRFFEAAQILISLGVILIIAYLVCAKASRRVLLHVFRNVSTLELVLVVVIGAAFAWPHRIAASQGITNACAIALFLFSVSALRFSSVMKRDLANVERDERSNISQPITRGDVAPEDAKAFAKVGEWYALASGWVLGWPIAATFLLYLAASHLTRDRQWSNVPFLGTVFRAVGCSALALAGMYLVTQDAKITQLALLIVVIAFCYRGFIDLFLLPKLKKAGE